MNESRPVRRLLAVLCCLTLLYGCGPKKENQAAENQQGAPAVNWPREITKDGNRLTFYQPQVDAWTDYRQLDGRVAIVLTPAGEQSVTGMITLQAQTDTDFDERTVAIHDIRITSALFPSLDDVAQQKMRSVTEGLFPKAGVLISLDRMLAAAEDSETPGKTVALKTDPPKIFVSIEPAILLLVDGEPVRAPLAQTSVEVIVNANWDLFFDKARHQFYLSNSPLWLQAPTLNGPWTTATSLPSDMSKLPDDWADVKKTIPPSAPTGAPAPRFSTAILRPNSSHSMGRRSGKLFKARISHMPPIPTAISSSITLRIASTTSRPAAGSRLFNVLVPGHLLATNSPPTSLASPRIVPQLTFCRISRAPTKHAKP